MITPKETWSSDNQEDSHVDSIYLMNIAGAVTSAIATKIIKNEASLATLSPQQINEAISGPTLFEEYGIASGIAKPLFHLAVFDNSPSKNIEVIVPLNDISKDALENSPLGLTSQLTSYNEEHDSLIVGNLCATYQILRDIFGINTLSELLVDYKFSVQDQKVLDFLKYWESLILKENFNFSLRDDDSIHIGLVPLEFLSSWIIHELFDFVVSCYAISEHKDEVHRVRRGRKYKNYVDLDGKDNSKLLKDVSKVIGFELSRSCLPLIDKVLGLASNTTTEISQNAVSIKSTSELGREFETYLAGLYRQLGYLVEETSVTGDYGIDLIVSLRGERVGIQCKNYTSNVGVHSIMEAYSGAIYHDCSKAEVVTTVGFTKNAEEMAEKLNVYLRLVAI